MLMASIDQGVAGLRSGGAGDAAHRQAFATPHPRFPGRPEGQRFQRLETSSGAARDASASPRDTILAQASENAVMAISITRTGS